MTNISVESDPLFLPRMRSLRCSIQFQTKTSELFILECFIKLTKIPPLPILGSAKSNGLLRLVGPNGLPANHGHVSRIRIMEKHLVFNEK